MVAAYNKIHQSPKDAVYKQQQQLYNIEGPSALAATSKSALLSLPNVHQALGSICTLPSSSCTMLVSPGPVGIITHCCERTGQVCTLPCQPDGTTHQTCFTDSCIRLWKHPYVCLFNNAQQRLHAWCGFGPASGSADAKGIASL